ARGDDRARPRQHGTRSLAALASRKIRILTPHPRPSMDIAARVEKLRHEIRRHDRLYYVDAKPEISDREYDKLCKELADLETKHPELATDDSPTKRVGGELIGGFKTVRHAEPMLSIDNTYSSDELREFDRRIKKLLPGETVTYVVEPKIDGVAISLVYEKGQ